MSYVALYPSRRRRRYAWKLPVAAGIASMLTVMWFSVPTQEPPSVEPEPAVGHLLHAGPDSAVVRGVLALPDGSRLAAVSYVRGQHGRLAYVVEGCPLGGVLREFGTARERPWSAGGTDIASRVAGVVCRGQEQEGA